MNKILDKIHNIVLKMKALVKESKKGLYLLKRGKNHSKQNA